MSGTPLRVALLSPRFWPEVRRGSERFARELADGLIRRGHEPELITSHRSRTSRRTEDGLPVTRLWRPPEERLRRRELEDFLTHLPGTYVTLRRGGADVAHALYPTDALAAARWGRLTGRPAVLSWMGLPTRRWLAVRRRRAQIAHEATRRCDAVVALSATAAAALKRELGADARVIAPPVDLEAFSPGDGRSDVPTVICAAALDQPQKRVGLLVEAFAMLRRQRPDARLILSRPAAGAPAPAFADRPGVELRDLDSRAALAAAYRESWVSALPSWGEAFGLVLVEAMACGTPVVGSREGAIPEVVDDERVGQLFAGDRPEALAQALLEALELSQDPATAAACRTHASQFSSDRAAAEYEALYRELLER